METESDFEESADSDELFGEEVFHGVARDPSFWARGEYLCWWTKGNPLPPLVTTSPPGTPRTDAGVLGLPGTETLFGSDVVDDTARSGFRLTLGQWLDSRLEVGVEATWFSVFDDAASGDFSAQSTGTPTLARPFFDVGLGRDAAELTAFTDPNGVTIAEGAIAVRSSSEMHSAAIDLRRLYRSGTRGRIDLIGGYRYFRYREGMTLWEQVIARDPGGVVPVGTTFDLADGFATRNDFHGGELGVVVQFHRDLLSLELLAKVALGNIRREVRIDGWNTVTGPPPGGGTIGTAGGLLALPTNIGRHTDEEFAALPEFGANLTVALNDHLTFTIGYTLMFLNGVARSGEQMDLVLNSSQLTGGTLQGAPRPVPLMGESGFWAQGLQVGAILQM